MPQPGFSGVVQIPNFTLEYARVQASNSATTVLTGPESGCYEIISILLSESSGNATTALIRLVPDGGSPGATHDLYNEVSLTAKETKTLHNYGAPLFIMNAAELLTITASAASRINMLVVYRRWK